jgi:L-threonylcarbamoyladenylate synthase
MGDPAQLVTTDVGRAAECLAAGGLVGMPTETVYGLAADATDADAIRRIYAVKERPADHPLIVHLGDADDLAHVSPSASADAVRLAQLGWPGPLTLVVPRGDRISAVASGGRPTIAVRRPAHPVARELLRRVAVPLAAPSANRFGAVSPTTAAHVVADLADRLDPARDCVLDGGPCPVGVESTIVDCTTDPPQLLRAGAVSPAEVDALLGRAVAPARGPARASGMLTSHYAPACRVRVVDTRDDAEALRAGTPASRILDRTDDLGRYAHELYAELRRADADGVRTLIAVLPPPTGLGHAIRDRLLKAAAPRPPTT